MGLDIRWTCDMCGESTDWDTQESRGPGPRVDGLEDEPFALLRPPEGWFLMRPHDMPPKVSVVGIDLVCPACTAQMRIRKNEICRRKRDDTLDMDKVLSDIA